VCDSRDPFRFESGHERTTESGLFRFENVDWIAVHLALGIKGGKPTSMSKQRLHGAHQIFEFIGK
jgi:hypothetical protein